MLDFANPLPYRLPPVRHFDYVTLYRTATVSFSCPAVPPRSARQHPRGTCGEVPVNARRDPPVTPMGSAPHGSHAGISPGPRWYRSGTSGCKNGVVGATGDAQCLKNGHRLNLPERNYGRQHLGYQTPPYSGWPASDPRSIWFAFQRGVMEESPELWDTLNCTFRDRSKSARRPSARFARR